MRKPYRQLMLVALLSCGAAFAQSPDRSGVYVGGSVTAGYLFDACIIFVDCGGVSFGVSAHVGAQDLLALNADGRLTFGVTFANNLTYYRLAADAIYEPQRGSAQLITYLGSGLRLGFMSRSTGGPDATSGVTMGLGALFGVRYGVTEKFSAFAEAGVDLMLTSGFVPSLSVGANLAL